MIENDIDLKLSTYDISKFVIIIQRGNERMNTKDYLQVICDFYSRKIHAYIIDLHYFENCYADLFI